MEVTLVATDPEGLSAVLTIRVTVEVGTRDYDGDDDGLIDVGSLAQLHAMRYDLNGDGSVDEPTDWSQYHAAFVEGSWDMGCPDECIGYELTTNLDFDTDGDGDVDSADDYWNDGDGWVPVWRRLQFVHGDVRRRRAYRQQPVDRGSSIAAPSTPAGLFGMIRDGILRDVGLADVDVTGGSYVGGLVGDSSDGEVSDSSVTGSVSGDDYVGGLVGRSGVFFYDDLSHSAVTASHATAEVSGDDYVGGLVGLNVNTSEITASHATGHVEGAGKVGGLVGYSTGPITTSYATGHVEGTEEVGGLVGFGAGNITASYATGHVEGTEEVGGLVGFGAGNITASYATGLVWGDEKIGGLVGNAHPVSTRTGELLGHSHLRTCDWDRWPHHDRAAGAHGLRRHLSDLEPGPGRRHRGRRSLGLRHERPVSGPGGGHRRERGGDLAGVRPPGAGRAGAVGVDWRGSGGDPDVDRRGYESLGSGAGDCLTRCYVTMAPPWRSLHRASRGCPTPTRP